MISYRPHTVSWYTAEPGSEVLSHSGHVTIDQLLIELLRTCAAPDRGLDGVPESW